MKTAKEMEELATSEATLRWLVGRVEEEIEKAATLGQACLGLSKLIGAKVQEKLLADAERILVEAGYNIWRGHDDIYVRWGDKTEWANDTYREVAKEREACALIAENFSCPHVANAIRDRE